MQQDIAGEAPGGGDVELRFADDVENLVVVCFLELCEGGGGGLLGEGGGGKGAAEGDVGFLGAGSLCGGEIVVVDRGRDGGGGIRFFWVLGLDAVADDEVLDLLVDEGGEVGVDDDVAVAVADDQAVAVRNREPGDVVAVFDGDGGRLQGAQVEEDDDLGRGDEFDHELAEDGGDGGAVFVEEDAKAFDGGDGAAAVFWCELNRAVFLGFHKMSGWEAVGGLGGPLLLLAEAPEDEERGLEAGDGEREPGADGDLD